MEAYFERVPTIQPTASGQGNLLPVTGAYILENISVLKSRRVSVYQVSKDSTGAFRADPIDPTVAESLSPEDRGRRMFLVRKDWKEKVFADADEFDARLLPLLDESAEQRVKAVGALKTKLADLKNSDAEPIEKAREIMDTVSQVFLLNKASLKLKVQAVTANEKSLAKDTEAIVGTALEMADDPSLVSGLFSVFSELSNGQTINHVVRVFASYTGFLKYYNLLHQRRLSQTLRRAFPAVYADAYRKLLPNLPSHLMTSDNVLQFPAMGFLEMKEYSLGALLHDIGKMGNIDYFEGDAAFDPRQIRQHVFLSVGLIMMNYGLGHEDALLLAGDHHNALGHSGGYGVTRMDRERTMRPPVETIRCLSSTSKGFVTGEALGYLPVEMLSVTDVYDAMIDNSRAYKKPMDPIQATTFLEQTMVAQGKLDPVLVDIFIDFLRTQGIELPEDRGFAWKTRLRGEPPA